MQRQIKRLSTSLLEGVLTMTETVVRLGTRGSALACWQTAHVCELLQASYPQLSLEVQVINTHGDQVVDTPLPLVGGKGVFTAELETALKSGTIDLATHSLKDLPTEPPQGLAVGAVPRRANPADVMISRCGYTLEMLPTGATVGTSSQRRAAQLLHWRPDLHIINIRGNVDTRIRKAMDQSGPYDAIILAYAGLQRLDHLDVISEVLPLGQMLPAPGQGALGIQCRDEVAWLALLAPINHLETEVAVTAERAFLVGLGGGCSVPIASYASVEAGHLYLRGRVCTLDGSAQIDLSTTSPIAESAEHCISIAYRMGIELARTALEQGAAAILEAIA